LTVKPVSANKWIDKLKQTIECIKNGVAEQGTLDNIETGEFFVVKKIDDKIICRRYVLVEEVEV